MAVTTHDKLVLWGLILHKKELKQPVLSQRCKPSSWRRTTGGGRNIPTIPNVQTITRGGHDLQ